MGAALAPEPGKERQAGEDERCAQERAAKIADKAGDENDGGTDDKESRDKRVSPDAIGTRGERLTTSIPEDSGGGEHVKKPLGEDGQLEQLLEAPKHEQQPCG